MTSTAADPPDAVPGCLVIAFMAQNSARLTLPSTGAEPLLASRIISSLTSRSTGRPRSAIADCRVLGVMSALPPEKVGNVAASSLSSASLSTIGRHIMLTNSSNGSLRKSGFSSVTMSSTSASVSTTPHDAHIVLTSSTSSRPSP
eukprot:CAMPEP_0174707876 /NCGR_PEP_ID=MMETSP1094-20130205/10274_1 /TAXON_ID=156173 /ORGANISM="Chrysochromulina brevifilum, Strain UTEX LB 985" /LENGTH=144 /DNA_ID=CAMNT_0015906329 /DNA_START=119 /DNA_END=550 /DNA_ORIENTATION=+